MSTESKPLPEFGKPPVMETVLAVEFPALSQWQIPHFGLFWETIRNEFPKFQIQPPIVEFNSDEERIYNAVMVELMPQPVRCWYESSNQLIQVQQDRFISNWRKQVDGEEYPRFDKTLPKFTGQWEKFLGFLAKESIPLPQPNRCEVTYVNHFEQGLEWKTQDDLAGIFSNWASERTEGFLPTPVSVAFNIKYPIPGEKNFLAVQLAPAIRKQDQKSVLQLTMTAKVKPASPKTDDVLKAFDSGHEWVVRGFADITTPGMHKLWERKK